MKKRLLPPYLLLIILSLFPLAVLAKKKYRTIHHPIQEHDDKKKKSSWLPWIGVAGILVLTAGGVVIFWKKKEEVSPPIDIKDLKTALNILKDSRVKFMNTHYELPNFFTTVNKEAKDLLFTDGANSTLGAGGGTTGGLQMLGDIRCPNDTRIVKGLDGELRSVVNDPNTKQPSLTQSLKEGEVVISTRGDLTVAHMLGVQKNTPKDRKTNADGIRKIFTYGIAHRKSIVFCVFSGGVFAGQDIQMKKDMTANLLITVADEIQKMKRKGQSLSQDIFFNCIEYHKEEIKKYIGDSHIIDGALD